MNLPLKNTACVCLAVLSYFYAGMSKGSLHKLHPMLQRAELWECPVWPGGIPCPHCRGGKGLVARECHGILQIPASLPFPPTLPPWQTLISGTLASPTPKYKVLEFFLMFYNKRPVGPQIVERLKGELAFSVAIEGVGLGRRDVFSL